MQPPGSADSEGFGRIEGCVPRKIAASTTAAAPSRFRLEDSLPTAFDAIAEEAHVDGRFAADEQSSVRALAMGYQCDRQQHFCLRGAVFEELVARVFDSLSPALPNVLLPTTSGAATTLGSGSTPSQVNLD